MTPNPGFKVTGYLKVEYFADGARVFIVQSTAVDNKGLYRKRAKNWGRRWCFTPLIEINHNSVKFRWTWWTWVSRFYWSCGRRKWWCQLELLTSMQTHSLSEEGFGYNYGHLKSSVSHTSRENTLLRCGKIPKWLRRLILQRHRWAWLIGLGGHRSVACVY